MRCSPLYADGKIYTADQNGRWYILRPDGDYVETISKGRFRNESVDASPICSHGRVYFTTSGGIYCLADPEKQPGAEPLAAAAAGKSVEEMPRQRYVQVIPAELLVQPGRHADLSRSAVQRRGQFLKRVRGGILGDGPGTFSERGGELIDRRRCDSPGGRRHGQSRRVGGRARVRIVPPLPWEFTFRWICPIRRSLGGGSCTARHARRRRQSSDGQDHHHPQRNAQPLLVRPLRSVQLHDPGRCAWSNLGWQDARYRA